MSGVRAWILVAGAALMALVLLASPASSTASQYFGLEVGTPAEVQYGTSDVFTATVFVLGEPAGGPANLSETLQAWQGLSVTYLGVPAGPVATWAVSGWFAGGFTLTLNLTTAQVGAIEAGQAEISLNSTVLVDGVREGASGVVGSATLLSATLPQGWWSRWFGIGTPPPDMSPASASGLVADLAWWGESTAGRASYAATTIVAVSIYLWEGHKLARRAVSGEKPEPTTEVR